MTYAPMTVYLFLAALVTGFAGPAQAQTRTWNGGATDDNWSSSNNWGGYALAGGESLAFGGSARLTNVNDLAADTSFAGLTFNSGAGLFSLSGNRITLGGNVVNNVNNSHRLNFDMVLDAVRTFNMAGGNLYASGVLSGPGGINVSGANNSATSILVLTGTNTYSGATTVSSGTLRVLSDGALGSADQGTTIATGARLELAGNVTVTGEVVTINEKGGNNGALQVQAGSNTWAGKIILGSNDSRIGVGASSASGILVVSGTIDDGANAYNLGIRNTDGLGTVVLSGTNTYKGETKIVVGVAKLSGGDNRLPTNTVVRLGNTSNFSPAVLDLNGQNQTVAGLTQDGTTMFMAITNSSAVASTLTVNTRGSAYTYSGYLFGNVNLTKGGSNTLTLSANVNPFSGQTTVREGKLVVNGPWVLQDSTFNTGSGEMGVLSFGSNTVANFGGLIGTNDLALTNSSGAAVSLRIRGAQTTGYDGRLVGGCDFTKTGAGSFTMKYAGSYTGKTYLVNGKLIVPSEDALGVMPGVFVPDQITFDGGTLRSFSNFVFGANNRGVTLAAGGGTLEVPDYTNVFTVSKTLAGVGALTKRGAGVLTLAVSNAYDGVTTVAESVLRVSDNRALGSAASGTVVSTGSQLQLANGILVAGEPISISGAGATVTPLPPSTPQANRGALQADANASAEWAGPVTLASGDSRVGAQDGGNLTVSGVISGSAGNTLRTSSNPNDRLKGTVLKGQNTYAGNTEITRGTLFLGATNTLPAASVLDVHWSNANNFEYAALDLNGFDQTVGGLKNTGDSGNNAVVTNGSATAVTLTINQAASTEFGGLLAGPFSLVKGGAGTLSLTNRNFYSGSTTVSGGTLRTGVNNAVPTNTVLILSGGAFDIGTKTNTVASLVVTSGSTLALGSGRLTVASQGSEAWGGQLDLTGALEATTLRFLPTLGPDQLQSIRYNGRHVVLDAEGYVHLFRGTILLLN